MHVVMRRLSDVYGRFMAIELGSELWVVLSGLDEIKEYSMNDEATYRLRSNNTLPDLYSFKVPHGKFGHFYISQRSSS